MALLDTLLAAFKSGETTRVPLSQGILQGWTPAYLKKTGISAVDVLPSIDDVEDDSPTVVMLEQALEDGLPAPGSEEELRQMQAALVVVLSQEVAAEGVRKTRRYGEDLDDLPCPAPRPIVAEWIKALSVERRKR